MLLDVCFAVLAFVIIETMHTQISSLFLGKDGTELAYQVSGDYMKWIGYFSYLWVSKWQQTVFFADLEICARFDCKYGQPCDSVIRSIDFCTAFRHCICMACSSGRLASQLCNFLCGTEKILAEKCFGAGNPPYLKKQSPQR